MSSLPDIASIVLMTITVMVALAMHLGRTDPDPRSHPHRPRHLARH